MIAVRTLWPEKQVFAIREIKARFHDVHMHTCDNGAWPSS